MLTRVFRHFAPARRTIGRDECGASAVEFALFAPILVAVCLSTVDLGFAISERMALDHSLRIGAASAMTDPGEETVQAVIEDTAGKNFTVASSTEEDGDTYTADSNPITISATRFCACPSAKGTAVSCTGTCSGAEPLAFYRLNASSEYAGILLPEFNLSATLEVQVK